MARTVINQDEITRNMLNKIRLLEEKETNTQKEPSVAIAITDDPKFGQNVLSNQIEQFRSLVEGGAEFSKPNEYKVDESPLIYIPKTNNLVFSGVIPSLGNLKWQMVLRTRDGNGCFVWATEHTIINKENLQILNKLFGFYCNWKEQWNKESADLEKMADKILNG